MKHVITLILLILSSISWGQKETLLFKISKPASNVTLHMADSIFYETNLNYFSLETTGKDKIVNVQVVNGKVSTVATGMYRVTFDKGGSTLLKVKTRAPNGKVRLALVQQINVKAAPKPKLFLCDVPADSAIDKNHLIKNLLVSAYIPETNQYAQVNSFKLIVKKDTFLIQGPKIPIQVKHKLLDLNEGDVLKIRDAKIQTSNSKRQIYTIKRFNVFVVETDQYSVGKRKNTSSPFGE